MKNIMNFSKLSKNHQRVFRHRLKRKFKSFVKDLEYVMLHNQTLKLDIEDIIDVEQLMNLLEIYENHKKLQKR